MLDQIFCINIVHCVHMKAERPILAPKKTFKIYFSIWQLLGLERTLLSKLPHIQVVTNNVSLTFFCQMSQPICCGENNDSSFTLRNQGSAAGDHLES